MGKNRKRDVTPSDALWKGFWKGEMAAIGEKTRTIDACEGPLRPLGHPFLQGRARRGPEDVPSGQAQKYFREDACFSPHAHASHARSSLDATVGALDAAASSVAIPEGLGLFLPSPGGQTTLFGAMLQLVGFPHLAHRTAVERRTRATDVCRHRGGAFARTRIGYTTLRGMALRAPFHRLRLRVDGEVIQGQPVVVGVGVGVSVGVGVR